MQGGLAPNSANVTRLLFRTTGGRLPKSRESAHPNTWSGHPRLLGCRVLNAARESSVRYVELEQFGLWEYMMRTRHGLEVRVAQLGLWVGPSEFRANPDAFLHMGSADDVTRIAISRFNPRHNYTFEIVRYTPTAEFESVKQIFLSHISSAEAQSEYFELTELHGTYIGKTIEQPETELILGLSDSGSHFHEPSQ